jgi:hypothetical protein
MRRILFSLLILLTALRGMVGDVMAVEMTQSHGMASVAVQASASQSVPEAAPESGSHPCHGANSGAAVDSVQTAAQCTTCQVCHSPALQRIAALPLLSQVVTGYTACQAANWLSADLIQLQKPPLS